jgi:hypothetical protein
LGTHRSSTTWNLNKIQAICAVIGAVTALVGTTAAVIGLASAPKPSAVTTPSAIGNSSMAATKSATSGHPQGPANTTSSPPSARSSTPKDDQTRRIKNAQKGTCIGAIEHGRVIEMTDCANADKVFVQVPDIDKTLPSATTPTQAIIIKDPVSQKCLDTQGQTFPAVTDSVVGFHCETVDNQEYLVVNAQDYDGQPTSQFKNLRGVENGRDLCLAADSTSNSSDSKTQVVIQECAQPGGPNYAGQSWILGH